MHGESVPIISLKVNQPQEEIIWGKMHDCVQNMTMSLSEVKVVSLEPKLKNTFPETRRGWQLTENEAGLGFNKTIQQALFVNLKKI